MPSYIIVKKMEERVPAFVTKLSELGYVLRFKTPKENVYGNVVSKTWKSLLKTEDEVEAEKRYTPITNKDK